MGEKERVKAECMGKWIAYSDDGIFSCGRWAFETKKVLVSDIRDTYGCRYKKQHCSRNPDGSYTLHVKPASEKIKHFVIVRVSEENFKKLCKRCLHSIMENKEEKSP